MTAKELYGGRDPADVPAYTAREAAGLVGVPVSTLRSWIFGRGYRRADGASVKTEGLIKTPKGGRFLSFTNVVESHVLAGLRRKHEVALSNIRTSVGYVERKLHIQHPLAREQFKTDGVDLFVEKLGALINVSKEGQVAMREVLEGYLERVDYSNGRAVRFYPLHRDNAPRTVVIDPRRAFGRPVLAGTSVPVADIQARWRAGDDIAVLAKDYAVNAKHIQEALRATAAAA